MTIRSDAALTGRVTGGRLVTDARGAGRHPRPGRTRRLRRPHRRPRRPGSPGIVTVELSQAARRTGRNDAMAARFATVDEYIAALPDDVRPLMERIRRSIHAVVPDIGETISYCDADLHARRPAAACTSRPGRSTSASIRCRTMDDDLARDVEPYRGTEDTLRLPLDDVPYDLLERVVPRPPTRSRAAAQLREPRCRAARAHTRLRGRERRAARSGSPRRRRALAGRLRVAEVGQPAAQHAVQVLGADDLAGRRPARAGRPGSRTAAGRRARRASRRAARTPTPRRCRGRSGC